MLLTPSEFETIVEEALDSLPERFAKLLDNVAIVIEEEPTDEDLKVLEDDDFDPDDEETAEKDEADENDNFDQDDESDDELLGIYRGVPRTRRRYDMSLLPDQIAIFRGPILRVCRSRREAVREIRETVIHELGHFFGLGDGDMPY